MRRLIIVIGLVSVGVLVSVILLSERHLAPPQRLSDGSTLWPKQMRLGPAQFYHGSTFEKFLGRVLPDKGISFGKVVLPPPQSIIFPSTNRLIVQFQFFPINNSSKLLTLARLPIAGAPFRSANRRWMIKGDSNVPFVHEFQQVQQWKDGYFAYLYAPVFPRNSQDLSVSLEERDDVGTDWHEMARFNVKNPFRSKLMPWTTDPEPITRRSGRLEFTVGQVTFTPRPADQRSIWPCRVEIPFQVRYRGAVQTNWSADISWEDASGNAGGVGVQREVSVADDWMSVKTWHILDPNLVWNVKIEFGRTSGWPDADLCTVNIPVPLTAPMTAVCQGLPLQIGLRGNMLVVEPPIHRTDVRVVFVEEKDGLGRKIRSSGSWPSGHRYCKPLDLPPETQSIQATLAVERPYIVEFYTKPKWLRR